MTCEKYLSNNSFFFLERYWIGERTMIWYDMTPVIVGTSYTYMQIKFFYFSFVWNSNNLEKIIFIIIIFAIMFNVLLNLSKSQPASSSLSFCIYFVVLLKKKWLNVHDSQRHIFQKFLIIYLLRINFWFGILFFLFIHDV